MARINLLPWREELRRDRQRKFYMALGATAGAAALVFLVVSVFIGRQIDMQDQRNEYLRAEIRKVEREIERIEELEETRDRLISRKEVIERLQANRSLQVHLFDQVVRTVPTGVRLTSVQLRGTELTINGMTQSSARVSAYLRNLEGSPWLHNPDLRIVEAEGQEGDPDSRFRFRVQTQMRAPGQTDDEFDDEV